nr:hypothetical protein [Actinomadura sp. WMMB 499]
MAEHGLDAVDGDPGVQEQGGGGGAQDVRGEASGDDAGGAAECGGEPPPVQRPPVGTDEDELVRGVAASRSGLARHGRATTIGEMEEIKWLVQSNER